MDSDVSLARLVEDRSAEIVRRWSERAATRLSERLRGSQLVDHVPEVLRAIAQSLREGRPVATVSAGGGEHGEQRHRAGAELGQLMSEYALLRDVVLELAEETGAAVSPGEYRVFGNVLSEALAGSVTEFVRSREEALRESEARYRTLFTNMTEGFALGEAICDASGTPHDFRFVEMNDAFERQSGLRREDVQGRPMSQVLPHLERSWVEVYGAVATSRQPVRFESYNADLDRHFEVFCYSPAPLRFAIVFNDVTARRRTEEALRESEARFRALAEAMPQMVWTTDARGSIDYLNGRWNAYTGASESAPLEHVWSAIHPEDAARVRERWEGSIATGDPFEIEYRLRRADGAHRWQLARGIPVRDAGGAVRAWFGTTTDVHDLKVLQEALSEADRRKSEFLGVLSHELRNPLAPIRNALFLLERAPSGSDQAARAHAVLRRQTEHLTRLVDDLLDVTRISRGKFELRRGKVDLNEIAARTAEDHRPLFDASGVELHVELERAPLWVDGDATRLAQIVANLLQNSAKFTGRGGRVTLSLAHRGGDAEIRVRDDGAGIDPGLLAHVFEPFTQGDQTLARTGGGLGLGLALVNGLAELHGGSVVARSEGLGQGAEFLVRVPLAGGDPRVAS
jgi:PAS domain S-box-containing protein